MVGVVGIIRVRTHPAFGPATKHTMHDSERIKTLVNGRYSY
jgi:hypothetical protein